ncbi:hypothetical protein SPRG_07068 [Saprolegnia parasitica CBS 223.65]|uniref:STIL N-terminal domain-containing protein n=1 Tax=Saprolegnia parasitica (strain CBS 223.65) TaxID=695850 RepID=A0A067C9M4_SAPPC|nr:hypothetical protein SPRG_07068 [Saprolegnia parasitica CBS 223.65]KDO27479.1 hypothetical protein SPRG_07068 [Saprolegnia parasitica CBS 223.65]|eukprot:XP_012201916.1 hypothetical protein SPRG_07068 [Saprolegnia parasitica CBS 223.65]
MMPRRRQKSAFFPDTEDEDTSCAEAAPRVPPMNTSFRMAPQGRAVLSRHAPKSPKGRRPSTSLSPTPASFNSGAYLGTIEFPSTRSVLWDRRSLGAAQVIHPEEAMVPKITLTASVLGQIHEAVLRRSSGPQLLGHVLYSQAMSSQNWAVHGTAFSVNTDPRNLSRPPSSYPVFVVLKDVRELGSLSSYDAMVHGTTYTLQHGGPLDVALSMRLVVSLFMPTQLNLTMELMAPTAEVHLLPIRNLPLLLTPLAKALMKLQSTHESGLVTLDKTRKMVPLLPTDPLATSRPLVGLWLQASSATSMYYQSLLYHTMSVAGREQLWVAPRTCLVVKYPTEAKQWLPEFFEMTLGTEETSPATIALFTTTRRVTVGRSANVDVVELYLQQSHQPVPTAPVPAASPVVHEPEPAPHADDSMSYDELPTPMPRLPPTNPVAKPDFRPLSPRPAPPAQAVERASSDHLLREHQEQMQAMQRQIQMLQDQLQAVQRLYKNAATPKETQSVGTNTSFIVASPPSLAVSGIDSLPLDIAPSSPNETTGSEPTKLDRDPSTVGGDDDGDAAPLEDAPTDEDTALAVHIDDNAPIVLEDGDTPDVVEVRQSAPTQHDAPRVDDANDEYVPLSDDDEPSSGIQYVVEPEEIDDYLSEPSSVTYPLLRTQFDSATLGPPAMPMSTLLETMDIPRIRYRLSCDDDSEEDEVEVRAIEAKYLKRMVKSS